MAKAESSAEEVGLGGWDAGGWAHGVHVDVHESTRAHMRTRLIEGLGHTTLSATVPVSRSRTIVLAKLPFYFSSAFCTKPVGIAHKLCRFL